MSAPRPPFTLDDNDKAQPLWLRLKAHLIDRLYDARFKNDGAMGDYETASLRGEIRVLKRLISLGDDRPLISGSEEQP